MLINGQFQIQFAVSVNDVQWINKLTFPNVFSSKIVLHKSRIFVRKLLNTASVIVLPWTLVHLGSRLVCQWVNRRQSCRGRHNMVHFEGVLSVPAVRLYSVRQLPGGWFAFLGEFTIKVSQGENSHDENCENSRDSGYTCYVQLWNHITEYVLFKKTKT